MVKKVGLSLQEASPTQRQRTAMAMTTTMTKGQKQIIEVGYSHLKRVVHFLLQSMFLSHTKLTPTVQRMNNYKLFIKLAIRKAG